MAQQLTNMVLKYPAQWVGVSHMCYYLGGVVWGWQSKVEMEGWLGFALLTDFHKFIKNK